MEQFVNAAACGDLEDIKRLLADKSTSKDVINHTDKDGRTALHYACLNDDINLLPLLLGDERVEFAKTTPRKEGIFHLTALYSSMQAIGLLVKHEHIVKLINTQNKFGETPLHLCAGTGNKKSGKTALLLLDNGADLSIVDQWKRGPIDVANFNGHKWLGDILSKFLKENKEESFQKKVNEITKVATENQRAPLELNKKAVLGKKNLFAGGFNINLKKTKTTEKHMFSSNQGKVVSGNTKAVTEIKKNLSKLIDFPGDKEEITKLIKDPELDILGKDSFGLTALMKFASWNKPELIQLILPQLSREQLNVQDLDGKTALHWACEMASVASVSLLVKEGADKEVKDKKGRTPLDILNSGDDSDIVERLKKALKA